MINNSIRIGEKNTLKINRFTEPGAYLMAEDESVVLLPNAYVTQDMQLDQEIEVFVYTDSEDRIVATTEEPLGYKDQFIYTKVVDVTKIGAFVDMGLSKDLFVPRNRQKTPFKVGEHRIVRILKDVDTNRLYGEERITKHLLKSTKLLTKNQEVSMMIFAKTPLGFKVIIENSFEGLLYSNEIFQPIQVGDKLNGYVKAVRKDGKIDVSLQPIGKANAIDLDTKKILDLLKLNDGSLGYNYKTDPETITNVFGLSKKAYKRALTSLVESQQIIVKDDVISLMKQQK